MSLLYNSFSTGLLCLISKISGKVFLISFNISEELVNSFARIINSACYDFTNSFLIICKITLFFCESSVFTKLIL